MFGGQDDGPDDAAAADPHPPQGDPEGPPAAVPDGGRQRGHKQDGPQQRGHHHRPQPLPPAHHGQGEGQDGGHGASGETGGFGPGKITLLE